MLKPDIIDWIHQEFEPVMLATPDETISQIIDNAIRYWNTHSAFPIVKMFPGGQATIAIPMSPDFKTVVKVYPSTVPDWVLQNYPLWTLLGITIIDNLTSDLVMLSEAYRNYKYYIGTDFNWHYEKSDNPAVGGKLYLTQVPTPTSAFCVVGTKRMINGTVTVEIAPDFALTGTLPFAPVEEETLMITNGIVTYTDDGAGILVSSQSGMSGTIDYATGVWTVTGWAGGTAKPTATYTYNEEIKSEYILQWILYYIKSLVKMVEGNTLRKTEAIGIRNDGQAMYDEGKTEKENLEKKLGEEGRWLTFVRRF